MQQTIRKQVAWPRAWDNEGGAESKPGSLCSSELHAQPHFNVRSITSRCQSVGGRGRGLPAQREARLCSGRRGAAPGAMGAHWLRRGQNGGGGRREGGGVSRSRRPPRPPRTLHPALPAQQDPSQEGSHRQQGHLPPRSRRGGARSAPQPRPSYPCPLPHYLGHMLPPLLLLLLLLLLPVLLGIVECLPPILPLKCPLRCSLPAPPLPPHLPPRFPFAFAVAADRMDRPRPRRRPRRPALSRHLAVVEGGGRDGEVWEEEAEALERLRLELNAEHCPGMDNDGVQGEGGVGATQVDICSGWGGVSVRWRGGEGARPHMMPKQTLRTQNTKTLLNDVGPMLIWLFLTCHACAVTHPYPPPLHPHPTLVAPTPLQHKQSCVRCTHACSP
jgi:hypothetical protein